MRTHTHTVAKLELSQFAYDEIALKLREAGYDHAFVEDFIDMTGIGVSRSEEAVPLSEPDFFWRSEEPEEAGYTVTEAMNCSPFFAIDEIKSSYAGPTRFYFKAPCLDPDSDDEDELGFDTKDEALAAMAERKRLLLEMGKIEL